MTPVVCAIRTGKACEPSRVAWLRYRRLEMTTVRKIFVENGSPDVEAQVTALQVVDDEKSDALVGQQRHERTEATNVAAVFDDAPAVTVVDLETICPAWDQWMHGRV